MKTAAGLITVFIVMPIWYWLLYQVLTRVNASELMFFLYWVYVPAGLFSQVLVKFVPDDKPKKVAP